MRRFPRGRTNPNIHDLEDIYRRQETDRALILETREKVAGLDSKVDSILHAISQLSTSTAPRPTNWIGIGSLLLAIMIALGGYLQTRLSPTERLVYYQDELVRQHEREIAVLLDMKQRLDR